MAQALFVAVAAGFASAFLSGALTPGFAPIVALFLVAPLPLLLAGLAWHVYVAVLGGIVGGLAVQLSIGNPAAYAFLGMCAVPAFLLSFLAERIFSRVLDRPQADGIILGQLAFLSVIYAGLLIVLAAMLLEPDYAAMQTRLAASVREAGKVIGFEPPGADPKALEQSYRLMAGLLLPTSATMILASLAMSFALALQLAARAGRLAFAKPDLRRFRLPGGSLILFGATLLIALSAGYLGLFGTLVAAGLALALTLQGLAVTHARTIGKPGRGLLLGAAWGATIALGLPAFVFLAIGLLDHLMDFRRGRL